MPAHAADPTAPYAELAPDSGRLVPGGQPLRVDALFHNTLDADVTDSFIVAVGARLAPPPSALTPDQITVEWFDAAASVWRSVELTSGDTALSGYLSTDDGLPSVGSLPAGETARIGLRISLARAVPTSTTLQFVAQGLVQPIPGVDPVPLMDGKASYSVVAEATATPSPTATATSSVSASPSDSASPSRSVSASATTSVSATPSTPSTSSAPPAPAPSSLSGGSGGDQLADSGTPGLALLVGTAAVVSTGGVALVVTRRPRRD
ncbi:hypothetical protein [Streptomyces chromofuscus]|uniref:Uncharacterized protein n=1 Tax=Streptomyces chromofuscus TaxID=42881 RepID=A0A7M2T8H9_STRCW|nr:hypothetical protein [Streptomyces chromofuscus]QOV44882.1 hypothetical protein IPT68_02415 [Streptomyces chromofuscus]